MNISKEEAMMIRMAFTAFERSATSDEPHIMYGDEYAVLSKKIRDFIDNK